jgi:hypothetical protein
MRYGAVWYSFSSKNIVNYDGAPGGTSPVNGQLATAVQASGFSVTSSYPENCFVPTISALDVKAPSPYIPVPAQGAPSPFDAYCVSSKNNEHILITPQIVTFLLAQLAM